MRSPNRDELKEKRQRYVGRTVKLIEMKDKFAPASGTMGMIESIDDAGQIHVHWETGSCLALVPGVDKYEIFEDTFRFSLPRMNKSIRKCVEKTFSSCSRKTKEAIIHWLCDAWAYTEDTVLSSEEIELVRDYHYELSEQDMFNWIHDDKDEPASSIHSSPCVAEMDNVLVLDDGDCFFWYEIRLGKQ